MKVFSSRRGGSNVTLKLLVAVLAVVCVIIAIQTWLNIDLTTRQNAADERQNLQTLFNDYHDEVELLGKTAAALADSLADRPDVSQLLLAQDRQGLLNRLTPLFNTLKARYNIVHLYVHQPDGTVFVRIHDPEHYGDDITTYRQVNVTALNTHQTVAGVELDPNRMGIRGVAPIMRQDQLLGLVEVGLDYDQPFLETLRARHNADYTMWVSYEAAAPTGLWPQGDEPPSPSSKLFYYAGTRPQALAIPEEVYQRVLQTSTPEIQYITANNEPLAVLVGPLLGYNRRIIGVLEISMPRTQALAALRNTQWTTFSAAGGLTLLALLLMAISTAIFVLRPLNHLTAATHRQLAGDLTARVRLLPNDEFGQLGRAFNRLTEQLNTSIEAERYFSQQLAKLHQVSLDLSLVDSLDDLCRQAIELGRDLLGFDRMSIWFVDPQDPAYMLGMFGVDEQGHLRDERENRIFITPGTMWSKLLTGELLAHYQPDDELMDGLGEAVGYGPKILVSLWDGKKTIGMIAADNLLTQRPMTKHTRDLLALFAQVIGHLSTLKRAEQALHTQQEAERQFSQQLAKLHDVSLELSMVGSFDDLCRQAIELGCKLLGLDRMGIWFIDPQDPAYLRGTFGVDEQGQLRDEREDRVLIQSDIGGRLLAGEFSLHYQADGELFNDNRELVGHGHKIIVALWDGKKIIGLIAADNLISRQPINERKRDLLVLFAQAVGHLSTLKQVEEALRQNERKYRQLIETTSTGFVIINNAGQVLDANQEYVKLTGHQTLDQIQGRSVDEWTAPYQKEKNLAAVKQCFKQGFIRNLEIDYINKSGHVTPVEINATIVATTQEVQILSLARDITTRKQAEAEIIRLQHLLQNITNSMPSALIALNPAGEVLLWNPAAAALTGQNAAQVQGKTLWAACPALARYRDLFEQVLRECQIAHRHREVVNDDSPPTYRDVNIFPLAANDLEGAVLRIDDITPRVHLEEVMLQSAKMASVGGLAAGVAHEINNPLGAMMQSAQMLQMAFDTTRPRTRTHLHQYNLDPDALHRYIQERGLWDYLDGIRVIGSRAAKIVADLLSFSRKTSSVMALHNLNHLVEQTLDLAAADYDLKKRYDFRDIEIIRQLTPNLPQLTCDGQQIQQVVLNLVRNAAQAMAENKGEERGRLTLRTSIQGHWLRLEVEDNGPGIPEKIRDRLFEPFFTTKDIGEGTGLGLWLCWSIVVERHHGRIWAETGIEQGCRFVVELPMG